jgi:hypothetical protein
MHNFVVWRKRPLLCIREDPYKDGRLGECSVFACCNLFWFLATNYGIIKLTEQRTDCRSVGKEVSHHVYNPKIHYRIHKSLTLDPILDLLNPVHSLTY